MRSRVPIGQACLFQSWAATPQRCASPVTSVTQQRPRMSLRCCQNEAGDRGPSTFRRTGRQENKRPREPARTLESESAIRHFSRRDRRSDSSRSILPFKTHCGSCAIVSRRFIIDCGGGSPAASGSWRRALAQKRADASILGNWPRQRISRHFPLAVTVATTDPVSFLLVPWQWPSIAQTPCGGNRLGTQRNQSSGCLGIDMGDRDGRSCENRCSVRSRQRRRCHGPPTGWRVSW